MEVAHLEPANSSTINLDHIVGYSTMPTYTPWVQAEETAYIVSADSELHREATGSLEDHGIRAISFFSEEQYSSFARNDTAACLILDVELCGASALEIQRRLPPVSHPPVIFVSNPCNIRSAVLAMKTGAIDFIARPVQPHALLTSVRLAFEQDYRRRQKRREQENLQQKLARLTPREREVLPLVVGGLLNKQSASLLDISEVTLQIHRSQIMRKMAAESLPDLVRMALKLRIPHWREN